MRPHPLLLRCGDDFLGRGLGWRHYFPSSVLVGLGYGRDYFRSCWLVNTIVIDTRNEPCRFGVWHGTDRYIGQYQRRRCTTRRAEDLADATSPRSLQSTSTTSNLSFNSALTGTDTTSKFSEISMTFPTRSPNNTNIPYSFNLFAK